MSYTFPLAPSAGIKSTSYTPYIYAIQSGTNLLCYTESDYWSNSIPASLGTVLSSASTVLASNFLGIHRSAGQGTSLRTLMARGHDTAPRWSQQNPSSGVFTDAGMSAWLTDMKNSGATTVVTVFHTPTWASARPTETGDPYGQLGALAEPLNMSTLGTYITWLMTNYGSQIDYLEIWNEPKYTNTNSSYFSGTPAKLAEIARTINQAAKAVKPSIQIMGVGCTGLINFDGSSGEGVTYTNQFLAASDGAAGTGKDWIDILSVHTYVHDGTNNIGLVPSMKAYIDGIKTTNSITGMDVWSTEYGFVTPLFNAYTGPLTSLVDSIIRYTVLHVSVGIKRCIWYKYNSTYGWLPLDTQAIARWNYWASILNGGTITQINQITSRGQVAFTINGINYIL